VGALGIPEYNAQKMRVDTLRFADLELSPKVGHGLHAVAVDEMREDFTPTLWNADDRITQVLFAGSHCDVGGGYPQTNNESGLSDAPLAWMTGRLALLGVKFLAPPAHVTRPDAKALAHRPWMHPPWNVLLRGSRFFPEKLALFQGVLDRIAGGDVAEEMEPPAPYRPSNLSAYVAGEVAAAGVTVVA
jgi:type VI secretion system (T6SS) phospholipase Tle1-like effector